MQCLSTKSTSKSPHISTGSIQESGLVQPMSNDQITTAYAINLTRLFNNLNAYTYLRTNQLQNQWQRLFVRTKLTDDRLRMIAQPLQKSLARYFPSSENKDNRNGSITRFTAKDFILPKTLLPLTELRKELVEKMRINNIETRKYFFCAGKGDLQQIMEAALRNLPEIIPNEKEDNDSDNDSTERPETDPTHFLSDKPFELE